MKTKMKPLNDGNPICPLTRFLRKIEDGRELKIGDVVYTEWYGDNGNDLGDVRDRNRFRLGVVYRVDDDITGSFGVQGNQYLGQPWFENLLHFLKSMPCGSGGRSIVTETDRFSSTWLIGSVNEVKKLFGYRKGVHVTEFMRILVELEAHIEYERKRA